MKTDTIAAIASGLIHSGIGIIRISGGSALETADKVFHKKGCRLADQPSHTIHYGFVYDEEEKLDEVMAVVMRAPKSYTGEDTVEIQCHGGPWLMKRILQSILRHGARLAEPGEFTKRAFLNGRIDLSQAEAVMGMIQAQNDFAKNASLSQLSGRLSEAVRDMRAKILYETAYVEAALDDPEHISLDGYEKRLADVLYPMIEQIRELIRTADNGIILAEGLRTVILGRPNAGKSTLLNQLVGEERAIVTDIAGTTRDTLEENIRIGGINLRLIDTAGIRKTEDRIEQIGVDRAMSKAKEADLLIYVVDSSDTLDESDDAIIRLLRGRKAFVLMNKTDLPSCVDQKELERKTGKPVICISAKEGTGISKLKSAIEEMFDLGEIGQEGQITITNIRHKEALVAALESLQMVRESLENHMPEDFYTIDMMDAYAALGQIIGESVGEDLVNEIFGKFCMGK